ncbi:HAMP domain-containing protein [Desulfofundulus sp.]|uniref:HAMP domain-containing protein n=1 Tax=Desulfofundulus sp. TaxID=2282750 RepID=UPI003C70BC76
MKNTKKVKKTVRRISIATRMSIYFGLLISFLVIMVGCSAFVRIYKIMELQVKEKGEAVACAVAALTAERLQAGDPQFLNRLLSELKANEDIGEAAVVDSSGKIIAHTSALLMGRTLPEGSPPEAFFQKSSSAGPVVGVPVKTAGGNLLGYFYLRMDQGRTIKYLHDLVLTMVLLLLAAVYAGVMLAHIISKHVLRKPIEDLLEATRHIATGNFTYQVPVRKEDELGSLARAFNTMTGHLTNLFRTVHLSTMEMARTSQLILARTEDYCSRAGEDQKRREELAEITSAARRLARVVDRLNNLSLQFKIPA